MNIIFEEKRNKSISELKQIITLLEVNNMQKWADKYSEVLTAFENKDFEEVFQIINNSWINSLGWSQRGYPETENEEKLYRLSDQIRNTINDFRVYISYKMENEK